MRVVGGRCKGLRLAGFRGRAIRPTSDKVREAVFNVLSGRLDTGGARVLDLFAGTGAMGIEALSRGASAAVFVDAEQGAVSVITKNLDSTGLAPHARVLKRGFKAALSYLSARGETFDLVFVDPPYGSGLAPAALKGLSCSGLLAPGALVVVETSRRAPLADVEGFEAEDLRKYGDTLVYLFAEAGRPAG